MQRIRTVPALVLFFFLAGCTNALYQGELTALDAGGEQRDFVLYWTRTDPLIGKTKAGPAVLLTACSPTRIDFTQQAEGIIFRGMPGFDRLPGAEGTVADGTVCGAFLSSAPLIDLGAGPLPVRVDCEPVSDEFSIRPRNYPAVRPEPYLFHVVEAKKQWSLLGSTLPGPHPPPCPTP